MSKSLLSKEKVCFVCQTPLGLHRHHVYGGANRKLSEREGCWVWLCGRHHNLSNDGVHYDRILDELIKEECQRRWEAEHEEGREGFRRIFGRSYL